MSIYHDEIEIEDMEFDEETDTYYYPCPCGDKFQITKVSKWVFVWHAHTREVDRRYERGYEAVRRTVLVERLAFCVRMMHLSVLNAFVSAS